MQNPVKNNVRVCVVVVGCDFRRGSFSFPREVVRTEEVIRSDPLLSQQHQIFLCDGRCFLLGFFFSTSSVLFQKQPRRPICKVAKWIRQKIRLEVESKTSASPELAAPIPRFPTTIFAPPISRMADTNSCTNTDEPMAVCSRPLWVLKNKCTSSSSHLVRN